MGLINSIRTLKIFCFPKLFDLTKELPLQNLFMKILYLQILIVERKLKLAFELGIELIKEINNLKEVPNDADELIKFPALVISQVFLIKKIFLWTHIYF